MIYRLYNGCAMTYEGCIIETDAPVEVVEKSLVLGCENNTSCLSELSDMGYEVEVLEDTLLDSDEDKIRDYSVDFELDTSDYEED